MFLCTICLICLARILFAFRWFRLEYCCPFQVNLHILYIWGSGWRPCGKYWQLNNIFLSRGFHKLSRGTEGMLFLSQGTFLKQPLSFPPHCCKTEEEFKIYCKSKKFFIINCFTILKFPLVPLNNMQPTDLFLTFPHKNIGYLCKHSACIM